METAYNISPEILQAPEPLWPASRTLPWKVPGSSVQNTHRLTHQLQTTDTLDTGTQVLPVYAVSSYHIRPRKCSAPHKVIFLRLLSSDRSNAGSRLIFPNPCVQ